MSDSQIFTMNPDGTGLTQLTDEGRNWAPAWSPDGASIAYVHQPAGGELDLWVMAGDGTAKRQVTDTGGVSKYGAGWSPNSKSLAFGGPCITQPDFPAMCDDLETPFTLSLISATEAQADVETLRVCVHAPPNCDEDDVQLVSSRIAWPGSAYGDLLFASEDYGQALTYLLMLDLDTRLVRYFRDIPMAWEGSFNYPVLSHDDKLVAYDYNYGYAGEPAHVGIQMCGFYRAPGCDAFPEKRGDGQLAFNANAKKVVFNNSRHGDKIFTSKVFGAHRQFLVNGVTPSWQRLPRA